MLFTIFYETQAQRKRLKFNELYSIMSEKIQMIFYKIPTKN